MSLVPGVVLKDSLTVLKALSSTLSEGERQVLVNEISINLRVISLSR